MGKDKKLAQVFHYDLYGKRAEKYDFLQNNTLQTVQWRELELAAPQYFFVAKDFSLQEEYDKGFSVPELFPINSVGVVTAKDAIFVNPDKKTLLKNIKDNLDINPDENLIQSINYRPFDNQYIYYDTKRIERARENVMQHFLKGENIGLITSRQCVNDWRYVFISKEIAEFNLTGTAGRFGSGYVFPLYLYPETDKLFADKNRKPNLNETIINGISQRLGLQFTDEPVGATLAVALNNDTIGAGASPAPTFAPINILDYIYAVLHSPAYRERYKEFLKIDFPRVPYPENAEHFWKLAELGGKLRRLHLLEGVEPQEGMADYPVAGNNVIEKPQYIGNKVYINDTQYFDHVPSEAWSFYIGGYQPAQKWLKDRKGRELDYEDIRHYQKIIRVLKEMGEVMKEIIVKQNKI
jgi:predicted helicase